MADDFVDDSQAGEEPIDERVGRVSSVGVNHALEAEYLGGIAASMPGATNNAIADRVRASPRLVETRLRLLRGDRKVFDAVRARRLNLGAARLLNAVADELVRAELLECATSQRWTIATLRNEILARVPTKPAKAGGGVQ